MTIAEGFLNVEVTALKPGVELEILTPSLDVTALKPGVEVEER